MPYSKELRHLKGSYPHYFLVAVDFVLKAEGGYTNNTDDPGGETKYGISRKSYPDVDIPRLTVDRAVEIYYKDYWLRSRCDAISDTVCSPMTAIVLFDTVVNCGLTTGISLLQRAVGVKSDGLIGNQTLSVIHASTDLRIAINLIFEREDYYDMMEAHYSNLRVFARGWERRLINLLLELVERKSL